MRYGREVGLVLRGRSEGEKREWEWKARGFEEMGQMEDTLMWEIDWRAVGVLSWIFVGIYIISILICSSLSWLLSTHRMP